MHNRCIFLRVSRIIVNSLEIITKYSTKIYALITKNIWHIDKKLSFCYSMNQQAMIMVEV